MPRGLGVRDFEELLGHLKGSVPADWQVLVLADRGLDARWLYTAIGAWGWHRSLMQDAGRVERLWLAMAVAMGCQVSLGSQADSQRPEPCLEQLPKAHIARKRIKRAPTQQPPRRLSCLQRGHLILLAALF